MEKGCRRAGPDPVRPTRFVDTADRRALRTASSYKNQRAHPSEPLLAAKQQLGIEAARPQRGTAMDEAASVLSGIETAVHVPAGLEHRDRLRGHHDLGAIAGVSSGVCVARLDPEHAKAA